MDDIKKNALAYYILWRAWQHHSRSGHYTAAADIAISDAKDAVIHSLPDGMARTVQQTVFAILDWEKEHAEQP